MKLRERIYCIEGIHDWGDREIEPTVEPMLQLLRDGVGLWDYVRRDCATEAELKWYLHGEWWNRCRGGSILYFCSHGDPATINLSDNSSVDLGQLSLLLEDGGAEDCLVHFGGCSTMKNEDSVREFKRRTGAWAVSGYGKPSDWYGVESNALALEYMYFSSVGDHSSPTIVVGNNKHKKRLQKLTSELRSRFKSLDFQLLL